MAYLISILSKIVWNSVALEQLEIGSGPDRMRDEWNPPFDFAAAPLYVIKNIKLGAQLSQFSLVHEFRSYIVKKNAAECRNNCEWKIVANENGNWFRIRA